MLNHQQLKAVNFSFQPLYLNAGAGTGKTKTLLARFHFLSQYFNVKSILILTFNKSAVKNLKKRLNEKDAKIMTFHGFALMFLKQNLAYLKDFNLKDFKLIDEIETREIIRNLLNQFQIKIICGLDDVIASISKIKRKIITNINPFFKNFFHAYNQVLCEKEAIDFDDLIVYTYYLLKKYPFLLSDYQQKFPYLLVDESQDIDYYQMEILKMLGTKSLLFMVGDEHQNIYSFRGTKNIYSQHLKEIFQMKELKLTYNYRSSSNILKTANTLLPLSYQLKPTLKTMGKVIYQPCWDETQEALFIIKEIKNLIESKKYQFKDIVILYRKKALKKVLEQFLKKNNIPFKIPQKVSYVQTNIKLSKEIENKLKFLNEEFNIKRETIIKNHLTLTSIHQMKGLESKIVFLIGCEQETFFDTFLGHSSLEEEKRLMYVAITRARELLYITHTLYRNLYAYQQKMNPLCFLKEMQLI
ncbi:ATP-dependent helicase [Columbia Basin potato purple top phytoplasma]|uniref:DNA 3'-5' helicase n=1 Tax=Columbia Basin potato purple top phytoplasma TaxID=307134 RepID=A0ABT5L9L0_9MOLU|nr:ATP-dependent helicase [Columbia Basin potato purple top phytoplasma]MDC9032280.1 ATP-dependent helicase [Columbia Basin potato purple top phytoplasma]